MYQAKTNHQNTYFNSKNNHYLEIRLLNRLIRNLKQCQGDKNLDHVYPRGSSVIPHSLQPYQVQVLKNNSNQILSYHPSLVRRHLLCKLTAQLFIVEGKHKNKGG